MTDRSMEAALTSLGHEIDWPAGVDIASRLRLHSQPPRRWRPAWVWAIAALVVVMAISLIPPARRVVANLLEVAGIRIEFGAVPDLAPPTNLARGSTVDLDEAQAAVDFPIKLPSFLGPPTTVHILEWNLGTQVFLVWEAADRLSEVGDSGTGLLLAEFRADLDEQFFTKIVGSGTVVEHVTVNGARAFWLGGSPHVFMFTTPGGSRIEDGTRLTGNVLIWEAKGITYRLESGLGRTEALEIAESLSP